MANFNDGDKGAFPSSGAYTDNGAVLTPHARKQAISTNYISNFDYFNQFLPDVDEKTVNIYGNRSINAFIKMVGAEEATNSDQIRWTEEGRLHIRYKGDGASGFTAATVSATALVLTFGADVKQTWRVGQTIIVQGAAGSGASRTTTTVKGVLTDITGSAYTITTYADGSAIFTGGTATATERATLTAMVYGSEFAKGTNGMAGSLEAEVTYHSNKCIILKDKYSINGSDTAQIGWVQDNTTGGYYWFMKSKAETIQRWEDYLEMAMVEGVTGGTGLEFGTNTPDDYYAIDAGTGNGQAGNKPGPGTEGFFAALNSRGNIYQDFGTSFTGARYSNEASGTSNHVESTGINPGLADFDEIIHRLDRQGAIEENMLFLDRRTSLAIDDLLARQNSYGENGTSWGVFNNSMDMALNLGFNGWRRGSYDFYKTDWRYLNDYATRGGFGEIEGVLVPAGTSNVYDQALGKNTKRPFLHVRYRASETDNRKMKSWITGSVGGAYTSDLDAMEVHFLSERCLITQGAQNFVLFTNPDYNADIL